VSLADALNYSGSLYSPCLNSVSGLGYAAGARLPLCLFSLVSLHSFGAAAWFFSAATTRINGCEGGIQNAVLARGNDACTWREAERGPLFYQFLQADLRTSFMAWQRRRRLRTCGRRADARTHSRNSHPVSLCARCCRKRHGDNSFWARLRSAPLRASRYPGSPDIFCGRGETGAGMRARVPVAAAARRASAVPFVSLLSWKNYRLRLVSLLLRGSWRWVTAGRRGAMRRTQRAAGGHRRRASIHSLCLSAAHADAPSLAFSSERRDGNSARRGAASLPQVSLRRILPAGAATTPFDVSGCRTLWTLYTSLDTSVLISCAAVLTFVYTDGLTRGHRGRKRITCSAFIPSLLLSERSLSRSRSAEGFGANTLPREQS